MLSQSSPIGSTALNIRSGRYDCGDQKPYSLNDELESNFSQKEMLSSERGEKLAGLESLRQQVKIKGRNEQTNK